uniref:SRPBCC domain-containing protein n=1 Tax=Chlorobium chlorochromatii (strain CaD3) TaxID=340177 RepID=Q3ASC3_CHLCH
MKSFESEIIIEATPAEVWQMLTAFAAYGAWNPFLRRVQGSATNGAQLYVEAKLPALPAIRFTATITTMQLLHRLGWHARFAGGLFRAHHFFRLEPQTSGGCRLLHGEEFSGLLAAPILLLLGSQFRAGYTAMNEALKRQVETNSDR